MNKTLLAIMICAVAMTGCKKEQQPQSATPKSEPIPQPVPNPTAAAISNQRIEIRMPVEKGEYNQTNHYNTPKGFMNDIQSIFKGNDGYYHFYYLLNSNYKAPNDGTEWYHVRTRDWTRFENLGVAIPKFVHGWSAMATGSIIRNQNRFFKNLPNTAVVAYFTSYTETGQHQYVAYSLDGGKSYRPYNNGRPVMKSANKEQNARDPYIRYDQARQKLMMYLAEGDKVGTYSSSNGINWQYEGATILNAGALGGRDLGLIECPVLMTLRGAAGETKYVLFFGANGYRYGSTTGTYYMVGHLDSRGNFVAEQLPERLDQGSDYYGANFYQENESTIKSIAWMGNWGYMQGRILNNKGQEEKHLGSISHARNIKMIKRNGRYVLESQLIVGNPKTSPYNHSAVAAVAPKAKDGYHKVLLDTTRWHSQAVNLKFTGTKGALNGHIRIFIKQADSQVLLDFNAANGDYEVSRSSTKITGDARKEYQKSYIVRSGQAGRREWNVHLTADKTSLEFVLPDGQTYSLVKLSSADQMQILVETSGDNRLDAQLYNLER